MRPRHSRLYGKTPALVLQACCCVTLLLCQSNVKAQQWKRYRDSAVQFSRKMEMEAAITFYNKAKVELAKDSLHTSTYLQVCKELGAVLYQKNDMAATAMVLNEGQSLAKATGSPAYYADFTEMLGRTYFYSNSTLAENYLLEAAELRRQVSGPSSAGYAQACNLLGSLYNYNGSWSKALQYLEEAKSIRETQVPIDTAALAQSYNNLADLLRKMQKLEEAEPLALKAITLRKALYQKDKRYGSFYAISCVNLGNIYRALGQFEKAEEVYTEAKAIREQVLQKGSYEYAATYDILAGLYHDMGRNDKAEALYLEAKALREKGSLAYAETIENLSGFYRDLHRYKEAEELIMEAQHIWEQNLDTNDVRLAINYNNTGQFYSATGNFTKAETYFLKSQRLWQNIAGQKHYGFALNAENLARVYWNTRQTAKANKLFLQSYHIQYDQLLNIFQFTSEREQEQYLKNMAVSSELYQSFFYQAMPKTEAGELYNMSLLNRNLVLNAARQLKNRVYTTTDTSIQRTYDAWINAKYRLGAIYTNNIVVTKEELQALEDTSNLLEKALVKYSSPLQSLTPKVNWQLIKTRLSPAEASIEFIRFRYHHSTNATDSVYYAAVLLRKNLHQPVLVRLFEEKQLDTLLRVYAQNKTGLYLRGIVAEQSEQPTSLLYSVIWKPLERYLAGIQKIYIAPCGLLHQVAFAALHKGNRMVSDQFQIVQLNTTASVVNAKAVHLSRASQIALYGGIRYTADSTALKNAAAHYAVQQTSFRSVADDIHTTAPFAELPGTKTEIEGIQRAASKAYHVSAYTGINATEESFKFFTGARSPAVIHVATHGFFFPAPRQTTSTQAAYGSVSVFKRSDNPLFRAGLLFAGSNQTWEGGGITGLEDGILTAYEVSNLYFPHTKLVVLSACETALGEVQGSEEVYGLQRAFKIAGVPNLVMSLWKVPDRETAEFMQVFYQKMFKGLSIADAFYSAQTTLKNKYRKDPYKWAAWILVQ